MLKTVKIGVAEYKAMKAVSQKEGRHLQYILTEAIRLWLTSRKEQLQADKYDHIGAA